LCHATESGAEEVEREEGRIDPLETVAWGWLVVAMEIRIGRKMKMRKCRGPVGASRETISRPKNKNHLPEEQSEESSPAGASAVPEAWRWR
jgi:hypothetical protein